MIMREYKKRVVIMWVSRFVRLREILIISLFQIY